MSTSYVTTVNISLKASVERTINRTLLLPANAPYLTFSVILFFLLNLYLVWETNVLQAECAASGTGQLEGFLFHLVSTAACILLIILSASKDILDENQRFQDPPSLGKATSAFLCWCLLGALFVPTAELYGNDSIKALIKGNHVSVLDFIPKKKPEA